MIDAIEDRDRSRQTWRSSRCVEARSSRMRSARKRRWRRSRRVTAADGGKIPVGLSRNLRREALRARAAAEAQTSDAGGAEDVGDVDADAAALRTTRRPRWPRISAAQRWRWPSATRRARRPSSTSVRARTSSASGRQWFQPRRLATSRRRARGATRRPRCRRATPVTPSSGPGWSVRRVLGRREAPDWGFRGLVCSGSVRVAVAESLSPARDAPG